MLSRTIIQRTGLTEFTRTLSDFKILYIQAPAGYGKTVFAAQWLECQHGPGALATMDEYDNAVEALCHKLRNLLESLCPKEVSKQMFSFTRHPDFHKAPAEFLMRAATILPETDAVGVVIDDLHNLTNPRALKLLHDFLTRLPAGAKVCILSRNRLPDVFNGQVLKQELGFIPKEKLLFDSSEICALYKCKGSPISEKQAKHILDYTEGWPLGINALLLSHKRLPTESISSELLEGFLRTQLWELWDEKSREFMVGTCMEDTLSESLCDALTGESGSGMILEQMLADGVFLSRQDGKTYRFHRLFQEFLQKLFLEKPEEYRFRQFRRAGEWYLEKNDFYQAVRRFSWCKDYDRVACCFDMLEEMDRAVFDTEQVMRVVHDTLDEEIAKQYPFLYFMMAFTARNDGRTQAFETYADLYYSNYPRIVARNPELAHNIFFLYAMDSRYTLRDIANMAAKGAVSGSFQGVRGSATQYFPLYHRSFRDFSEFLPGDIDEQVLSHGKMLGLLLGEERDMILGCIRGGLYYEKGELQKARELALSAAAELKGSFAPESKFCALMLLMTTSCALRQPGQADLIQRDIQDMIEEDKAYYLQHNFDAAICQYRMRAGDTEAAKKWLEQDGPNVCEKVTFFDLYGHFTTARACIALGNLNQAVILLEKIRNLGMVMKRPADMIEAEILLTIAFHKMKRGGQKTAALHLEQAILLAQPFDYVQAFINDSAGILPMLASLKNRTIRSDYTGDLSETFVKKLFLRVSEQVQSGQLPAAGKPEAQLTLTPQQKRVAKLMCDGYSYRKIADELGIRFSTVRSHIELIYRKLDASGMDEAIRKIRQLHLLDGPE